MTTTSIRPLRVLVVQGHRNTSGGDAREMAKTPGVARAINAAGHHAESLQGANDWFPGSLDGVAREVMARHGRKPFDVMLDVHFEGDAGNTRGVFAIVPDGDGLRTLTKYPGSDALASNPLDHALAREISRGIAQATGLPLRVTSVVEPGVMSERRTHVGADLGWRLAMFGYTAPARERMVRLVLECGNIRGDAAIIDAPGFAQRVGSGVVQGLTRIFGKSTSPVVPPPAPLPPLYPPFGTIRQLREPRMITVTVDALNARTWAETDQPILAVWRTDRRFWVRGWIIGEVVEGNPVWWITGKGHKTDLQWRVWSGGTDLSGPQAMTLPVA